MKGNERGSVLVETTFGLFVLMFLVVGVVQVALTLYARNVLSAAAHDGARAAVEVSRSAADAERAAHRVVSAASGSLVDGVEVDATLIERNDRTIAQIVVSGRITAPGPIPLAVPVAVRATSVRERFEP